MPWYCRCEGRSLLSSPTCSHVRPWCEQCPNSELASLVQSISSVPPSGLGFGFLLFCFFLASLTYDMWCPLGKLISLRMGAAILCVVNLVSYQSCTFFKNRLRGGKKRIGWKNRYKASSLEFPKLINSFCSIHSFFFPPSSEKSGGMMWVVQTHVLLPKQIYSQGSRGSCFSHGCSWWVALCCKISRAPFLILLLPCCILKLK